jgi:RecJ-like exonuclease
MNEENDEIEEIGLETCSACNGKKFVRINYQGSNSRMTVKIGGFNLDMPICPKCNGKGKVNWLVNVFEKEDEEINWFRGMSMSSGFSGTSGCTDHHEKRECYKTKSSKNWNGGKVRR